MEEILIQIFSGGSSIGIPSALTVLFFLGGVSEDAVNVKIKAYVGAKINAFSLHIVFNSFSKYAEILINIFFTNNYFSKKWFVRSFAVSAIFALLLHALFFFINPQLLSNHRWVTFFTNFVTYLLIFSSIDFLLLWKTQLLLKRLNKGRIWSLPITLLYDVVTSFLFGLIKYLLIAIITSFESEDVSYFFTNVITIRIPAGFVNDGYGVIPGLFFYTSFLYSLFFILYFVSVCFLTIAGSFDQFKKLFDIENKPFKFIQTVVGLILLFVVLTLLILKRK